MYITTNQSMTVLYTGVTNHLTKRIKEHREGTGGKQGFAHKFRCYHLVYFERHQYIQHAIMREKEIKGWSKMIKVKLIEQFNPNWDFLEDTI
ncbi:GIY-YIG nuclease family protein [Penaeicola halotolerans]|uniref:GIY-YIG nuclease family protein n=1 Tax=Penaeicola halotolerans TaxID=2793196 RepID=UPI00293D20F4|nr:GIY-YIG nuclease family protein [Penaeicola halotolerans]